MPQLGLSLECSSIPFLSGVSQPPNTISTAEQYLIDANSNAYFKQTLSSFGEVWTTQVEPYEEFSFNGEDYYQVYFIIRFVSGNATPWKYAKGIVSDGGAITQELQSASLNNANFIPTTGWSGGLTLQAGVIPTFPSSISATASVVSNLARISTSWTAPTTTPAPSSYTIRRSLGGVDIDSSSSTASTILDSLPYQKTIEVSVRSNSVIGNSSFSTPLSVTTSNSTSMNPSLPFIVIENMASFTVTHTSEAYGNKTLAFSSNLIYTRTDSGNGATGLDFMGLRSIYYQYSPPGDWTQTGDIILRFGFNNSSWQLYLIALNDSGGADTKVILVQSFGLATSYSEIRRSGWNRQTGDTNNFALTNVNTQSGSINLNATF